MKWLGILSAVLLAQILFVGFFLFLSGRLPERELSLLWNAIKTGESTADVEPVEQAAAEKKTPFEPLTFDEFSEARLLKTKELDRRAREAQTLLELTKDVQANVDSTRKKIEKLRTDLEKGIDDKQKQSQAEGLKRVTELLEAMQPKLAKSYLLSRTDENDAVGIIKSLDPAAAAKIFKEFTQPADIGKLNGWLAKLEQGEPESSALQNLKKQVPPRN